MRDLVKRCDEIIDQLEKIKTPEELANYQDQLIGSIQTIYRFAFNGKIPDEYSFVGCSKRYQGMGHSYWIFFNTFKGFVEELKHGFVNTLENYATLNVYGSMIDEARRLRKENDKNLNRAAAMFGILNSIKFLFQN